LAQPFNAIKFRGKLMVMSSRAHVCLLCIGVLSTFSYGVTPDRIQGPLTGGPKIVLKGNVHGLVKPENDLGRADGSRPMQGVTLAFHPSAAQQKDLDNSLVELGDPSSPNYHKYLTPKQFGERYGMSWNDLNKVIAWLQSEGFTNIKVANSRNEISFDGTVAQVESTFSVEMHHYLVDGVVHLANAGEPLVPAAIAGSVLNVAGLNTFAPKPRAKVHPHFTSYITGNHDITPADFATIYDLNSLGDGSGQKIAVIGQSSVNASDLNNFRSAAGLSASTITTIAVPSGSTPTRCPTDESESDLDLEWSGGVAKKASIIFVVASLGSGDTCANRSNNIWNALDQAVQGNVAPFVTTSYGFCESGLGSTFANQVEAWAQQAQRQGQTIVAATGDSGAADCEPNPTDPNATSATEGLAVDVPAASPEVTAAGGTEFSADSPTSTTNNPPGGNPPYWLAAGATTDTVSSALEYIPETSWNDTAIDGSMSASGGGSSTFFTKQSWQSVAPGSMRSVPDIALSASADHDPYLFCSEDGPNNTIVQTCTSGFRTGSGGSLTAVGGTSVVAPTFTAILALINQYLGSPGIAPVNPTLYAMAASTPTAFHDVTTGNNIVPCTQGKPNCPAIAPFQFGFSAGTGYDQVTGLGSVDAFVLAQAISKAPGYSLAATPASFQVVQGSSATAKVNLTPINGFTGNVTYTCSDTVSESTCTGPTTAIPSTQAASFVITTTAPVAKLDRPFDRGLRIFYATLFPGLLGIVFVAASRKNSLRGVRVLGMVMVLGFSTMWLGSCGGSSSGTKDPGTPTGTYSITVTGTATANGATVSRQTTIQLVVVP
jgi:subtilase family serine protease